MEGRVVLLLALIACAPLEPLTDLDEGVFVDTDPPETDGEAPDTDVAEDTATVVVETDETAVELDTDVAPSVLLPASLNGLNLLVNPGAETGDLSGWELVASGGDGWATGGSSPHAGSGAFATSYGQCTRRQVIDLVAAGFTVAQLDAQPIVQVGEWFREHCAGPDGWSLTVRLLDGAGLVITEQTLSGVTTGPRDDCAGVDDTWQEVTTSFSSYGPGLRTLEFVDGGVDGEFWAGHYGIWMDDAVLSLNNPP